MSRVRSAPRNRSGAVAKPTIAATTAPKTSPSVGSAKPLLARIAAA